MDDVKHGDKDALAFLKYRIHNSYDWIKLVDVMQNGFEISVICIFNPA